MALVRVRDLKIGNKVVLIKPDAGYSIDPTNPLQGTKWACAGTIIDEDHALVHVRWDNGMTNSYKDNELAFAEPPAEGRCESIWE